MTQFKKKKIHNFFFSLLAWEILIKNKYVSYELTTNTIFIM